MCLTDSTHSSTEEAQGKLRAGGAWYRIQGSTFGIPGVEKHAHFLRDVKDAEQIRNELLKNWTLANVPGMLEKRLEHSVIQSHAVRL